MKTKNLVLPCGRLPALLSLCATLAACGASHDQAATQAVAKVNNGEITVHQINQVLEQQAGLKPEQVEAASRQVLERLIDQELALQQALEQKIDREPRVVAALEMARRDIVARAYLEKIGGSPTAPTPAEVQAYFSAHPGLFSNRRLYQLQELNIDATPSQAAEVTAQLRAAKSPVDFTEWLKTQPMRHSGSQATQAPESLPIDLVDQLNGLTSGQALVVPQPLGVKVLVVLGTQAAPMSLEQSAPAIERFILNDRKRTAALNELARLRAAAKLGYLGKFAASAPQPEPTAAPAAPPAPTPASTPAGMDDAIVKKGLGLK